MAFVFMDLVYCNYASSLVIFFCLLNKSFLKKRVSGYFLHLGYRPLELN